MTVRSSVVDVSMWGLTSYAIWAGHRVSDLDMPGIALNASMSVGPITPSSLVTLCSPSKFGQPEQPETHAHEQNHAHEVVVGLIHVSRVPLHHGRAGMYTVRERAVCSITHGHGKA